MFLLQVDIPIDTWNLGSITGIVAITFFIVEILKAYIKPGTPYIGKVPVWVFPIVIACGLALLANKVIKLESGQPVLVGNTWVILGRAFLAAASASGLFSMIKGRQTTIGEAQPLTPPPKTEAPPPTDKP